jgi:hypothetical protein
LKGRFDVAQAKADGLSDADLAVVVAVLLSAASSSGVPPFRR